MLFHQSLYLLLIVPSKLPFFVLTHYLEPMRNAQLRLALCCDAEVLASENKFDTLFCEVLRNSCDFFFDEDEERAVSDFGRFEQIIRSVFIIQLKIFASPLFNSNYADYIRMIK